MGCLVSPETAVGWTALVYRLRRVGQLQEIHAFFWPPGTPRAYTNKQIYTCTHIFNVKKSLSRHCLSKVKIQWVCPKNYALFVPCPHGVIQTFIHFSVDTNPFLAEIFEAIFKREKKKTGKRAQTNKQNHKQTMEFEFLGVLFLGVVPLLLSRPVSHFSLSQPKWGDHRDISPTAAHSGLWSHRILLSSFLSRGWSPAVHTLSGCFSPPCISLAPICLQDLCRLAFPTSEQALA